MPALIAILVFVSAAAIDFANARYVAAVNHGQAHAAAAWSIAMYGLGVIGFVAVLDMSWWFMLPEALGFYIGTLLAMRSSLESGLHAENDMAPCLHGSRSP